MQTHASVADPMSDAARDPSATAATELPITLVDGRQHDYWRVSESRLRTALQAEPARSA